jgi:glutamate-1-semialdehyde 2,1-aminomutase
LRTLQEREEKRFIAERPKSRALFERARASLLGGVPMNWMAKWAGGFPLFVKEASVAHFLDVDGHGYVDLCLGDTGAMTGHSPQAAVQAIRRTYNRKNATAGPVPSQELDGVLLVAAWFRRHPEERARILHPDEILVACGRAKA